MIAVSTSAMPASRSLEFLEPPVEAEDREEALLLAELLGVGPAVPAVAAKLRRLVRFCTPKKRFSGWPPTVNVRSTRMSTRP